MDLKVNLDATPNTKEELTTKHVNQYLGAIIFAIQLGEKIRDLLNLE